MMKMRVATFLGALGLTIGFLSSCGKSVDIGGTPTEPERTQPIAVRPSAGPIAHPSPLPASTPSGTPTSLPSTLPSTSPSTSPSASPSTAPSPSPSSTPSCGAHWSFWQPSPQAGSVDLLFVVDSSASLNGERPRIAATIPAFIQALDPLVDFRVSVMQAHGGASAHSGRLYSHPGVPVVLDSQLHTHSYIQSALTQTLTDSVADADQANGEMGMYSFLKSLSGSHLQDIKNQGFYRPHAALATVFLTDENDICYEPQYNGYLLFPDFRPSAWASELVAYQKYCLPQMGILNPSAYPDLVIQGLKNARGTEPYSLSGIVHLDPTQIPWTLTGEASIGHGIIELSHKSQNGVLLEITDKDYSKGLAQLGNVASHQVQLQTNFTLSSSTPLDPASLQVQVDGKNVTFVYDPVHESIQIPATSAGHAGSLVEVASCKKILK